MWHILRLASEGCRLGVRKDKGMRVEPENGGRQTDVMRIQKQRNIPKLVFLQSQAWANFSM